MDVDAEMTGMSEIKIFLWLNIIIQERRLQNVRPVKAKCSYRRYTAYQTEKLFELVIEEGRPPKKLHS